MAGTAGAGPRRHTGDGFHIYLQIHNCTHCILQMIMHRYTSYYESNSNANLYQTISYYMHAIYCTDASLLISLLSVSPRYVVLYQWNQQQLILVFLFIILLFSVLFVIFVHSSYFTFFNLKKSNGKGILFFSFRDVMETGWGVYKKKLMSFE